MGVPYMLHLRHASAFRTRLHTPEAQQASYRRLTQSAITRLVTELFMRALVTGRNRPSLPMVLFVCVPFWTSAVSIAIIVCDEIAHRSSSS